MEILFSILLVVVGISTGFLISYYVINKIVKELYRERV